jgi:hypothetical protein
VDKILRKLNLCVGTCKWRQLQENCSRVEADHQQTRTPNTHRWHTHAATYCVIMVFGVLFCRWYAGHQQTRTPNTHRWHIHAATYCVIMVFGVFVCWWYAGHQQARTPNTHRWHSHVATYCVTIQTQRTQISGRNSNGRKHSGGPPEDGRRGFIITNTFLTFYWFLNVEVSVF